MLQKVQQKEALKQLKWGKPNIGFFFEGVVARPGLGNSFNFELKALKDAFEPIKYIDVTLTGK